ncbi:hypothetical protein Dimus_034779 [Dionaea muscipula]
MKLPFLSTSSSSDHHQLPLPKAPAYSAWQWPACAHLETLSFRAAAEDAASTSTSKPLPSASANESTPLSCFSNSSPESSGSFSTRSEESGSDRIETVIRGLSSDRLFFEPGESNSILEKASKASSSCCFDFVPYKESVFMSMESVDPFMDFRKSMEEMIEAHGLKDWDCLEELLCWYLKVNGKNHHGYIIGAFVDLLATLSSSSSSSPSLMSSSSAPPQSAASASSSSSSSSSSSERTEETTMATTSSSSFSCTSPSSPLSLPSSSLTTPCLSSLDQVDEDDDENSEENSHLPPP